MKAETYKKLFTFLHQTKLEYCTHRCTKDCPLSRKAGTSICSELSKIRSELGPESEAFTELVHAAIRKAIVDFSDKVS